jgi:16S rRNA (adenine1518-N6/adenine1519-N6)-dimethyltransferase
MPLTPSETTRLLGELGHYPKKKLGQNFLIDGNIVEKSIDMADLPVGMPVVEIGPGLGTLTRKLLEGDHEVHAVEIDNTLFKNLESSLLSYTENKRLTLTQGDAVKLPTASLTKEQGDYAVVANLPYAISSAWLESLLATERLPVRMVLMLQREAVDRMWAEYGTKSYSALSIFLHAAFRHHKSHLVSRRCFHPVPSVDSVLARMDLLPDPFLFSAPNRALIRRIFTQRRKQIGSIARQEEDNTRSAILDWLQENGIAQTLRPEQIEPEAWIKLANRPRN